jgi:hypothetical protein
MNTTESTSNKRSPVVDEAISRAQDDIPPYVLYIMFNITTR